MITIFNIDIKIMNITQTIFTQFIAIVSVLTASGVLLHDTSLDKAVISSYSAQGDKAPADSATVTMVRSNPHPHVEHLTMRKDQSDNASIPKANRRRQGHRKHVRGFHGDNLCLPLAGEWA